jgi:galactose-1-phosphate uridylyltransferase
MELSIENAKELMLADNISEVSMQQLFESVRSNDTMSQHRPDPTCQLDPRSGEMVLFNSARARRPDISGTGNKTGKSDGSACPICSGNTTPILDIRRYSHGFCFVNFNLFPIVYPGSSLHPGSLELPLPPDPEHLGRFSQGLHLLQWTNSDHELDWHNMPLDDLEISMQQLADLERKLLLESGGWMPPTEPDSDAYGYCSIIKNFGATAGASQPHGHMQIGFTNIMPQRFYENWCFKQRHHKTFTQYMFDENPASLTLWETRTARLLVPYFMRRPYAVILAVKNTSKQYLHELTADELRDLTLGISMTIRCLHKLMSNMGLEVSFQFTVQNGPGAGLYVEFFPQTQLLGGFEQLGLWICQSSPVQCAEDYHAIINSLV